MKNKSRVLLVSTITLLAVALPLLFAGGIDRFEFRSFRKLWDFGHVALFMALSLLALKSWKHFLPTRYPSRYVTICFIVISVSFATGITIEVIQFYTGRSAQRDDVINDLLGSFIILSLFIPRREKLNIRILLYATTLALMLKQLYPLSIEVYDDIAMYRSFPVLADFESPLQISRFEPKSNSSLSISDKFFDKGQYSLKVETDGTDYSGFSMEYLNPDWTGYKKFNFALLNMGPEKYSMDCQIYDYEHRNAGKPWGDRFQTSISVFPGWNFYSYGISNMLNTPKGRRMNRKGIVDFSCFTTNDPVHRTLYLDSVHLSEPL